MATRRLGAKGPKGPTLEEDPVPHLHVGWRMARLHLGSALPRRLVFAFALR